MFVWCGYCVYERDSESNIDSSHCMDRQQMDEIIRKGHSRVPVYEEQTDRFIGVMLVKNLIKLDPDDNLHVSDVFNNYKRPLLAVTRNAESLLFWVEFDSEFATLLIKISDSEFLCFLKSEFDSASLLRTK